MLPLRNHHTLLAAATFAVSALSVCLADAPIDFSLQVRPLLSDKCFHCHGPDEAHRQAELRLDLEDDAKAEHSSGYPIVPGDPDSSTMFERVTSDDPEVVMPPPSAHKDLKPEEIDLLRRWIQEGAAWGNHWSFVPPIKMPAPKDPKSWAAGEADRWVAKAQADQGLAPAPVADAYTLCRRLSLDLVGLPPVVERVDRFVAAHQQDPQGAVADYVDELLASDRFGEHWARVWLDLARYADTKGYEKDLRRDMWPYRDWVIDALNADMPLDQFTAEQLAGDLLPGSTQEQRIATAFHRSTLANDENGTDDEEFRVAAVKDRVETTMQVWMGLTMGCAKCHTHKYDPISIEDYYRVYALFNQTEDNDRHDDEPTLPLPIYRQQAESTRIEREKKRVDAELAAARQAVIKRREIDWVAAQPTSALSESGATLAVEERGVVSVSGEIPDKDVYTLEATLPPGVYRSVRLEALTQALEKGEPAVGRNPTDPGFVLSEFELSVVDAKGEAEKVPLNDAYADFSQEHYDVAHAIDGNTETGWSIAWQQRKPHWAIFGLADPLTALEPVRLRLRVKQLAGNKWVLARVRWSLSERGAECNVPTDDIAAARLAERSKALDEALSTVRRSIPRLPVLRELPGDRRRESHVMLRGNFLDPGEKVQPDFLTSIAPAEVDAPRTRLGLAEWLVSDLNPLTHRVFANRVWAQLFGRGLVETEEDFGSQGTPPTHPELLDYLAIEYRDTHQGSLKGLIRSIVSTRTYQQAYVPPTARNGKDPQNRWLSSGPRFRLPAEAIRDSALAVSGLLSQQSGGPPVMPPQPAGLWRSAYNADRWVTNSDERRYRRAIYIFWKRTSPYPSMEAFDATTREVCQVRRIPTNTPLQSLVTLNDPVYVEAAARWAERSLQANPGATEELRIAEMLRGALARQPQEVEVARLRRLLEESLDEFGAAPEQAQQLLAFANTPPGDSPETVAAWAVIASSVLNLDEFLTRP